MAAPGETRELLGGGCAPFPMPPRNGCGGEAPPEGGCLTLELLRQRVGDVEGWATARVAVSST